MSYVNLERSLLSVGGLQERLELRLSLDGIIAVCSKYMQGINVSRFLLFHVFFCFVL